MISDIKLAFRRLLRTPGFTATALATLAICLGANLAIFAVVDGILIRSLPFPRANRLVTIYYTYPKLASASNGASLTTYYERRGNIPALSSLSAISLATSVVGETGATSIENLGRVTSDFFSTLGVQPFMGRTFKDDELTYQTDHVAMISYEFWRSQFAADSNVLGKSIRMDGISRVIVGVLPANFRFLSFQAPVYMPLSSEEVERNIGARHSLGTIQIGRLADGSTLADAQSQLDAHDAAHAAEFPQAQIVAEAGCRTIVAPLKADTVASVRPTLLLLQAGAFCLLLMGGVNLVNLLLIRASGRARDLAIRQALGARQRHVVREVMTETILLTVIGAFLGLGVGAVGIRLIASFGADQLPLGAQITFNARLAVIALLGALMMGIVIAAPIIWFSLRNRVAATLQSESRGSTPGRATQRLRHGFIVAQVAIAFVLLAGAGLLGVSLKRAMEVSPGFRTDHVITGQFNLTWSGYHNLDSFRGFFAQFDEKMRALPGISAVGAISNVPVTGSQNRDVMTIPGYTPRPGETVAIHDFFGVAGDYFTAMGIPLHSGRFLEQADAAAASRSCVVDETFARHYWPGEVAIGKQLFRGAEIQTDDHPYTVVGVVGAVKQQGLTETKNSGAIYFPFSTVFIRNYFLVARTDRAPEILASSLARALREIDPDMPLTNIRSMETRITDSLATRRAPALMAVVFAGAALLLATIGLYGVMAYAVAQRTTEFGIRMALGAQRPDVLFLVFLQGGRLIVIGLVIGLIIALQLMDLMTSLLYDVSASDPVTLASVAALLGFVAALACFIPARRATKVDPMIALRSE